MKKSLKNNRLKVVVTGGHLGLNDPNAVGQDSIQWIQVPVLEFESLPIPQGLMDRVVLKPFDWILFPSERAVSYWTQALIAAGTDFPIETQVACIGERTAEAASLDGYTPDFYPTQPGTEFFLDEFRELLSNRHERPAVLIPMAEGGRTSLREGLKSLGCEVTSFPLYRTLPRRDIRNFLSQSDLESANAIVFTSPSSVDAFLSCFSVPDSVQVTSIGQFTAQHLLRKGYPNPSTLPAGDFARIREVLDCTKDEI